MTRADIARASAPIRRTPNRWRPPDHLRSNPPRVSPAKSAEKPTPNLVEIRLGGGAVSDLFGTGGMVTSVLLERRLSDEMSLGLQLSHTATKYSVPSEFGEYGYKYSHNTFSGRACYHVHNLIDDERVGLYTGGQLGYNMFSISEFGPNAQTPPGKTSFMVAGALTGGRFWFNPKFGVSVELGYNYALYSYGAVGGLSYASGAAGVALRF